MFVCYGFDDEPHPVTGRTHGKAAACTTAVNQVHCRASKRKQKHKRGFLKCMTRYEEAEGEVRFQSHGDLPRNGQQISDASGLCKHLSRTTEIKLLIDVFSKAEFFWNNPSYDS